MYVSGLTCVHAGMPTWLPTSASSPSHSCYKHVCPWMTPCECLSHPHLVPHLLLNGYMHQYKYVCTPHSHMCPAIFALLHIKMCTPVCPFLHVSHPSSHPTPWLGCAHASIHVCMSTWLPMSAPLHSSCLQKCAPWCALCACPCNTSSGATPWLECVCASMHVHQIPMSVLPFLYSYGITTGQVPPLIRGLTSGPLSIGVSPPIGGHFSVGCWRRRMHFWLLWHLLYVS